MMVGGGGNIDGLTFDLSGAKGFFVGKASTATANRSVARAAYYDTSDILMKIDESGDITPAVRFDGDIYFNLTKILRNDVTKELFLLGYFSKYGENAWNCKLIKVAQDGTFRTLTGLDDDNTGYGVSIETVSSPFDEDGNFYFQYGDHYNNASCIYKWTGDSAVQLVKNGRLLRVLDNGYVVYDVEGGGTYVKSLGTEGKKVGSWASDGVYIKSKNIYYYNLSFMDSYSSSAPYGVVKTEFLNFNTNSTRTLETQVNDEDEYELWKKSASNGISLNVPYRVSGNSFVNVNISKFEMQADLSLKCTYALDKYRVDDGYGHGYEKMKIFNGGDKIYFLAAEKDDWSGSAAVTLCKIDNLGEPKSIFTSYEEGAYNFHKGISFSENGDFIANVIRDSDGLYGVLKGNMETEEYRFKADDTFKVVNEIVLNF